MIYRYSLIILIFLTGLQTIGSAQLVDKPKVSIRLLCYQRNHPDKKVAIYSPDGTELLNGKVSMLPVYQLSDAVKVSTRQLTFLLTSDDTPPEWDPKSTGRMKVKLPATGNEFILLFLKAEKPSAAPYKILPIAAPTNKFKGGSYLLINGSLETIGGSFGKAPVKLGPGKISIIPAAPAGANKSRIALLHTWQKQTKTWSKRPFLSIPLGFNIRSREIIIFFKGPRNKILYRGIQDPLAKVP